MKARLMLSAYLKVRRFWRSKKPWIGAHSDHKQWQMIRERRESKER